MMKRLLIYALLFCSYGASAKDKYIDRESTKKPEQRIADPLKRMTQKEKIAQLQSQLLFLPDYKYRDFTVGSVRETGHFMHTNGSETAQQVAAAINKDTRKSIAASRFGIPALLAERALHGAQWGMAKAKKLHSLCLIAALSIMIRACNLEVRPEHLQYLSAMMQRMTF